MPEVIPISLTQVDFSRLVSEGQSALGRNLAASLDQASEVKRSFLAYISVLESLLGHEGQPRRVANAAVISLKHLHFGFLILGEPQDLVGFALLATNTLAVSLAKERTLAIVSGSLDSWKWLFINYMSRAIPYAHREIMNSCFLFFEQVGLQDIWRGYTKVGIPDSTFELVKS